MIIKVGDYLITKENQLFRIIDVHTDSKCTYYDIKSMQAEEVASSSYEWGQDSVWLSRKMPKTIRSVPRNVLKHMGKVIPEEKITRSVKILYGKTLT